MTTRPVRYRVGNTYTGKLWHRIQLSERNVLTTRCGNHSILTVLWYHDKTTKPRCFRCWK